MLALLLHHGDRKLASAEKKRTRRISVETQSIELGLDLKNVFVTTGCNINKYNLCYIGVWLIIF